MSRLFRILFYYKPHILTLSHPHTTRVSVTSEEKIPVREKYQVYLFVRSNVQHIVYHAIMNIILSNRNERLMKQINNS